MDNAGEGLDRHAAGRIVRRVSRHAGISKRVGPHTLRYAFITAALDAGVPLRDVQEAADFTYATTRPGGGRPRSGVLADVVVPALRHTATARGASVVSNPCAPTLQLRNQPNASTVWVHVTPGGPCR